MPRLALGPFVLDTPLARGGMGEVWRAEHEPSGTSVAVKLLPRALDDALSRRHFHAEVRSMAALDHPGIVHVLDYGQVDERTSERARDRLRTGAPWLAMELASGGSLAQIGTLPDWPTARAVLLSILDALAHAHARGVIHRDIKPGNVLLCTSEDLRPGLKLTDFGVAHAVGSTPDHSATVGTLHYMAPEQVRGAWWEVGPWTDLYALGCTAWMLLCGVPVFQGREGQALRQAHVSAALPACQPWIEVPTGFQTWIECLLAKDSHDRFKWAADAASALLALDPLGDEVDLPVSRSGAMAARSLESVPRLPGDLYVTEPITLKVEEEGGGLRGERSVWRPVALAEQLDQAGSVVPASWHHPIPLPPPMSLRGAGLGLLGLRDLRLVGREPQMDRLWEELDTVSRTGQARAVLIRGPAGTGKTRLADWLGRRAHELGLAIRLTATHGPADGPAAALGRMVERHCGCVGMARGDVLSRMEALMGPGRDATVLTDLIRPEVVERTRSERGRPVSAGERASVLADFVSAVSPHRVAVVLLDDAHWGPESLDWVLEMLQRPSSRDRRMVFLVTVRDEWVSAEAVEPRLRTLATHPRGRTVELGPLEPGPFHELLRNLLGLDAMAAAQVSERAAGNPRFAVDLVSAWGARGLLSVGPHGFELPVGVDTKLPEGPLEIWLEQTRIALEGLPDQAWEQLERAAVLGARVDRDAWNASCEGDPRVRLAIEEELIAAGLAVGTGDGWRFVQGMLREGLLASADGEGRLRQHHLACAETLIARDRPSDSERIGRHLLQAGELEGAIDRLLQGAESRGDQYQALDVLALAQDAMHRAELPAEDRRWGKAWCRRASLCMRVGRYDEAASWAQRAFAAATEMDWPKVRAHAAFERAVVALHQRRSDGEALADVALEAARVTRDGWFVARAEYVCAGAAMDRRDWKQAELRYETALQGFRVAEDFPGAADCLRDMGSVALLHGDLELASARYLEALPLFRSHGAILGEAHVLNGLAEVARKQGDLAGAETGYRDALRRFERVGAGHAVLARLNLGLVLVHQARWPEARETLEGARSWLEQQGRDPWTAAACAVLMPVYAGIGDWVEFDRTAGRAAALLEATGFAQPDIRWAAERASQLAVQAGDAPRAAVAEGIVAMQEARLAGVEG